MNQVPSWEGQKPKASGWVHDEGILPDAAVKVSQAFTPPERDS
jgi:hypothetical protein